MSSPEEPASGGLVSRLRPSWLAETTWPYGLLLTALLFAAGLLGLGVLLHELLRPGVDHGARLEAWTPVSPERRTEPIPREALKAETAVELEQAFAERGYDFAEPERWLAAVPPLALTGMPSDLAELPDPEDRKRLFVQSLLPLVLMANRGVRRVRGQVLDLKSRLDEGGSASEAEQAWLGELARLYHSEAGDVDDLLLRLDEVPVAIAIAQAVLESGWGTSRFAVEGNALFGARTWRDDLDGLVPLERGEGESFRVRSFGEPALSVFSYLHNLNSASAYTDWRAARAALRQAGAPLSAAVLLPGLERYSEQGADYVAKLERLIDDEDLNRFADARLAAPESELQEAAAGSASGGAASGIDGE